MEAIKEELVLPDGKRVGVIGITLTGEELMDFMKNQGLVDICHGKYTGEKQCIGPIPNKKTCQNKLTPCHNFNNDYCWNCIVNRMRELGKNKEADELAEKYL